ncbi:trypsin-like serine peptidase [Tabrizicola sp.]|uniref:trypsin-like serine peptidase n=1 Tax=Tabrizicola sp. TaxID=2005166 RepID=UPI003F2BAFA9
MRILFRTAFSLLATFVIAAPCLAQSAMFEASDYGQAQLIVRQNTGDAAAFIAASEGGAFEPISELSPNDRMAILSRPIGRIDVLLRDLNTGEEIASTCTGALLGDGMVMTNYHCLPQVGNYEVLEASILMNYNSLDGTGSARFGVSPTLIDGREDLDFAIAQVDPAAEAQFGYVSIGLLPPEHGATRVVIHHPLGRPKVMSRFRCLVLNDRAGPPVVAHRCDTLPGSSGSLMFDDRGVAVALHRAGGLDASDPTSFNMAIDLGTILQASTVLAGTPAAMAGASPNIATQAVAAEETPVEGTEAPEETPGDMSTDEMNDILKGN